MSHRFTDTVTPRCSCPHGKAEDLHPPPFKVTLQNKSRDKIPVIDPRLLINSSKVMPRLSTLLEVHRDIVYSTRVLFGVGTIQR
jgi:hypothetical protein